MTTFDQQLLERIRHGAANYARIPLEAVQPVEHQRVLVAHDRERVGTTVFKIVGKGRTIMLVWEEARQRVCWVMEQNMTVLASAA